MIKKKKTIPFNFSEKHINYMRRCVDATFNIAEGAVRAGKTIDNVYAFAHELKTTKDKIHLATGSTGANAKLNIGDANGFGLEYIFRGQCRWGKYKDNECLYIKGPSTGNRQRIVIFAGASKADSYKKIRGNSYGMWIATEVNLHHENTIKEAFNRQLAAHRRKIFWDLNPDNPNATIYTNYIDKYEKMHREGKLLGGYNYEHFTIHDNINISKERILEIISQYDPKSVWYLRDILGERRVASGLVYPNFDRKVHVVYGETDYGGRYFVSIDYGTINPMSMSLWNLKGRHAVKIKEYYYNSKEEQTQKTDEEYYTDLEKFTKGYLIELIIVDPSAASFIECIIRHNKYSVRNAVNTVADGIRTVSSMLNFGMIKIHESCVKTISEFETYRWNEKLVDGKEVVLKENDHAMDELRYFVMTVLNNENWNDEWS